MEKKTCPLCGSVADSQMDLKQDHPSAEFFDCKVCGWFTIESPLLYRIVRGAEFKDRLYLLTALSRKNFERQLPREVGRGIQTFQLNSQTIEQHLDAVSIPEDPLDRVDRLLQLVRERTESFDRGGRIDLARTIRSSSCGAQPSLVTSDASPSRWGTLRN
jgi:hypothetical protein